MNEPTWEVFLPNYLPPGLNGPKGLERRHWATKKRDKAMAKRLIEVYHRASNDTPLPVFTGEVLVEFTRFRTSGPHMDDENASSSWKDLGDAMQSLGIVGNDRDIRLTTIQKRDKFKGSLIRVEVPNSAVQDNV